MDNRTITQRIRDTAINVVGNISGGLKDPTQPQTISIRYSEDEINGCDVSSVHIVQFEADIITETIINRKQRQRHQAMLRGNANTDEYDEIFRIQIVFEWLCEKHPELKTFDGTDERRLKRIIYGLVQQGKTKLLLAIVWVLWYVHKQYVCIILMEMNDSMNQFLTRDVVVFNNHIDLDGFTLNIDSVINRHKILQMNRFQNNTDLPIMVGLANASQLRKMNSILGRVLVNKPTHLVVDEADDAIVKHAHCDLDTSKVGYSYRQLKDKAMGLSYISATTFAVMNEQDAEFEGKAIRMSPPPLGYQGINDFDYSFKFSEDDRKSIKAENYDPLMVAMNHATHRSPLYGKKYTSVLVNISPFNDKQEKVALFLKRNNTLIRGVFIYNKNTKNIRKVSMDGASIVPTTFFHLNELYDSFEMDSAERDINNPHTYVIVSGHMASRAISFRPSLGNGEGSLDFLMYIPASPAHLAQQIQAVRLCGVYREGDIKKMFMTTNDVEKDLKNELKNYETFLDSTCGDFCDMRQSIEGLSIIHTGKHDRKNVDDTKLVHKKSLCEREFDTEEQLLSFFNIERHNMVYMTEGVIEKIVHGYEHTRDRVSQNNMRNKIAECHELRVDNQTNRGHQHAWNEDRHQELQKITTRLDGTGRYIPKYVSACVRENVVSVVIWKDDFCDCEMRIDHLNREMIYIHHTNRNTLKAFSPKHVDTKIGILSH